MFRDDYNAHPKPNARPGAKGLLDLLTMFHPYRRVIAHNAKILFTSLSVMIRTSSSTRWTMDLLFLQAYYPISFGWLSCMSLTFGNFKQLSITLM